MKDAILRLKETILFKKLKSTEDTANEGNELSSLVTKVVEKVSPLLHRIPENMPEFTLHDPNHSVKIIEIIGKVLPGKSLNNLNSIELALIILSAYLHDIGMTCDPEEKESIISGDSDYKVLFKSDIDRFRKFEYYKGINDHRSATFIEDQVFTEYLRRNHVKRSAVYIETKLSNGELKLVLNDIPFWKHLVAICDGHGEAVKTIAYGSKWPRHTLIGENIINVQFLTLLLRLGDILDLDPERTPKIIYEFVNPKDPVSLLEWKKHRAILGHSISSNKILFEAECSNPEVERALKQFMDWIEYERRETISLLEKYHDDISKKYFLELKEQITKDRIRSDDSYISNDLKFEINYQRVLDLLMGQRLYKNTTVALRELLQNSLDAIKVRENIYIGKAEIFQPKLTIQLKDNVLSISDNGVGMNESVFKDYFLQVGKSFYSSPTFYSKFQDVDITSEFGIGVLSIFMVGNSVTIESRREPENPVFPDAPVLFEIPTAYSYITQKKSHKTDIGTTLTINLKADHPYGNNKLEAILQELIPYPNHIITIIESDIKNEYSGIRKTEIRSLEIKDFSKPINPDDYSIKRFDSPKSFTHKLFTLDFKNCSSILADIEGTLSIVNCEAMNWYPKISGAICQRRFKVGLPEEDLRSKEFKITPSKNIKNIFPNWTSFYCDLNLTKASCLTLTPDRTDFIVDEKYRKLKDLLEEYILEGLKKHFESIEKQNSKHILNFYQDLLIRTGFLGLDLNEENSIFPEKIHNFLSTTLTLPVLNKDGRIERKSYEAISKNKTIAIINDRWESAFIPTCVEFIKKEDVELIILPKLYFGISSHRIDRFITALIGNKEKLLSPHTILTSALPNFTIEIFKLKDKFKTIKEYDLVHSITNNIGDSDQILFIPRQSIELYPKLNASHLIIAPLSEAANPDQIIQKEELKSELSQALYTTLNASLKRIAESDHDFSKQMISSNHYTGEYTNYYKLTANILNKDRTLLNEFSKVLESFWNKLKSKNLVETNAKMPKISNNDFASYWFTPEE